MSVRAVVRAVVVCLMRCDRVSQDASAAEALAAKKAEQLSKFTIAELRTICTLLDVAKGSDKV